MHSGALPFPSHAPQDASGDTLWRVPAFAVAKAPSPRDGMPPRCPERLVGTTLSDRYRVEARLGEGGMAVVYRARHASIGQQVAIKVLRSEFCNDPRTVTRFLREAQATSRVRHDHVVAVSDFGVTHDQIVYCVMEALEGEDLAATLEREGPLPWQRAIDIVGQLCDALQAAHDVGIVHRDIKPRNCFRMRARGRDDFIKVLDFGIAKLVWDSQPLMTHGLTGEGVIFGTPEYIAPEQAKSADDVDARADIYATGVLLYELLTGRAPFTSKNPMMTLAMHIYEPVVPPSRLVEGLPPAMDALVLRALEKDPGHRFQSMNELKLALEQASAGADLDLRGSWGSWGSLREASLLSHRRANWIVSAVTAALCVAGTLSLRSAPADVLPLEPHSGATVQAVAPEPTPPVEVPALATAQLETQETTPTGEPSEADDTREPRPVPDAEPTSTATPVAANASQHADAREASKPSVERKRTRRKRPARSYDPWRLPPPPKADEEPLPSARDDAQETIASAPSPDSSTASTQQHEDEPRFATHNPFAAP